MNANKYVKLIASAILATAAPGLAATADITGHNQWAQDGGAYGGTVTTINATSAQHASGNASLVFDVADGTGLSYPVAGFTATTGGTVTVSMKMYFPSTSTGAFLFGFDDGNAGYDNGWYVTDASGSWRDRWVAMKFVVNLDSTAAGNGTYYFDDMVTPAGTFDYGSTTINNLWFLVGNSFNGGTVSGPFYFDDMLVEKDATTIWSDNFDSYLAAGPPVNDNFADAIALSGNSGSHSGTGNVSATLETDEPTCVYPETTNTVWFKWTCAASGSLMVSTTGSTNTGGTEWDACLGIYTGASLATLTQLASQDSGLDETLSFAVTAGTTYYIQAGGFAPPSPGDAATNILLSWTFSAPPPNVPGVISIDVVRTDSTAVSGDVTGSPVTGQTGLWNRLVGSVSPQTLSTLTNGAGAVATGVGFQIVGTSGYTGFQSSGTGASGVVLAANDPERLWVSGNGTRTFAFTGLTVGGAYTLAVYNTGSSKGVLTINGGTPHTGLPTILVTNEVADSNGKITIVESFNGAADSDYMEISGFQIFAAAPAPTAYEVWAGLHAGGGSPSEDANQDGVPNGIAYFMGATGRTTNPSVINGKVNWPCADLSIPFVVEVSSDLSTWLPANPADVDTTSSPGHVIFTLPTGATKKFCRLMVTP